jgi:1-aminocyclopropane-1-carboxylate deaminase/D-cysteine desulfhydrase-like pyridoxal-dependent ACC family enzyme
MRPNRISGATASGIISSYLEIRIIRLSFSAHRAIVPHRETRSGRRAILTAQMETPMPQLAELDQLIVKLPRKHIGFYPTPFHKLENLSRNHRVNIFMKREDMAGPGTISGSKMRQAEFIIGQALKDDVDTIITQGVYLTNSGMQFAGENYAVPSAESTAAIRELARSDGVFIGPVYTDKGFAGMLDHARTGRIESGSNVAFLHTGDTGNLFETSGVVGNVTRC